MAPLGSLVGPRPLIGRYGQQHRLQLRERATYDPRACGYPAVSTEPAAIGCELVHTRTIVGTIDPGFANDGLDEAGRRNLFRKLGGENRNGAPHAAGQEQHGGGATPGTTG